MIRLVSLVLLALLIACSSGPTATAGDLLACRNVQKANQGLKEDPTPAYLRMATAARLADDHRLVIAGEIMQEAADAVLHNDELAKASEPLAAARIEEICQSFGVNTKATP